MSHRDTGSDSRAAEKVPGGVGGRESTIWEDAKKAGVAILYHLVQNHPVIDGNKRTGAMAAFVFLKLNGFTLEADESVFETLVLQTAQGQVGKDAIADFFRENTKS